MLYHLLKSTLHSKANACNIGTFIRFYMQSTLHSKANACNIGTFIRFYIQMRVQIKNKAFAYRFYRPFTQQCLVWMPFTHPKSEADQTQSSHDLNQLCGLNTATTDYGHPMKA